MTAPSLSSPSVSHPAPFHEDIIQNNQVSRTPTPTCFVPRGSVAVTTSKNEKYNLVRQVQARTTLSQLTGRIIISGSKPSLCPRRPSSLPLDNSPGEAGVWLPGIPVGSHHHQLPSRHRSHPGLVWSDPVQITLCGVGESVPMFISPHAGSVFVWRIL